MVRRLSENHEAREPTPWRMEDLPEPYVQAMLKGIVGVELAVAKLEDKFKLSQNRPAGDRPRIISALDAHGDPDSAAVAALMRSRAPAPSRQPSKPNKAATASGRAQASTGSATRRAQPA